MKIDALTPTATTSTSSNQLKGTKDEFLKLFMAQLQHQDPLAPKTGADMVAQLAQMTAVEQAQQTNAQLEALAAAQASSSSAGMASLVGRTCDAAIGDVQIDRPGGVPPIEISATGPIKGGAVVITDATGKELRRIPIADGARSASVAWDGKDAGGKDVPAGSYHVAVDPGTSTGTITSTWRARIEAVELTADGPRLRMGGVLVTPAAIRTIGTLASSIPTTPGVDLPSTGHSTTQGVSA